VYSVTATEGTLVPTSSTASDGSEEAAAAPAARRLLASTRTVNIGSQHAQGIGREVGSDSSVAPALTYYSTDDDVSVRIESKAKDAKAAYLGLRNQQSLREWKIGPDGNGEGEDLVIRYGSAHSAAHTAAAIVVKPSGNIAFFGDVSVHGQLQKTYSSSLQCVNAPTATSAGDFSGWSVNRGSWTALSTCPEGYSTVGVGSVSELDASGQNYMYTLVDQVECADDGCRVYCRSSRCSVQARCCNTPSGPLACAQSASRTAPYREQMANSWGEMSTCSAGYSATGFQRLELHNWDYQWRKYVKDFEVSQQGVRAWISSDGPDRNSGGGAEARCCKPRVSGRELRCVQGQAATSLATSAGTEGQWGPYSGCPAGYAVVGVQRIKVLGEAGKGGRPNVRQYECDDSKGCRAWCDGAPCEVQSKCCKV